MGADRGRGLRIGAGDPGPGSGVGAAEPEDGQPESQRGPPAQHGQAAHGASGKNPCAGVYTLLTCAERGMTCWTENAAAGLTRSNHSAGPAGSTGAVTVIRYGGTIIMMTAATEAAIPPGEVSRLLEPFQRLGRQRVGQAGGHGLGLAIVQSIARAHGARLGVRARPEGGPDVTVRFIRS